MPGHIKAPVECNLLLHSLLFVGACHATLCSLQLAPHAYTCLLPLPVRSDRHWQALHVTECEDRWQMNPESRGGRTLCAGNTGRGHKPKAA